MGIPSPLLPISSKVDVISACAILTSVVIQSPGVDFLTVDNILMQDQRAIDPSVAPQESAGRLKPLNPRVMSRFP